MNATIDRQAVSYETRLAARELVEIDLVVIHCTELPDMAMARHYAEQIQYPGNQTGACGHYYIDQAGALTQYVAPSRVAHHCVGFNERSLGIELDNLGRYPDWLFARCQSMTQPYPALQIDALLLLLTHLQTLLPALRWIAGHEELDTRWLPATDNPLVEVRRKRDPGPLFPWQRIEDAFVGRLQHAVPPPRVAPNCLEV
jgi:N-acetylmuramoyl-L-alanine amidase